MDRRMEAREEFEGLGFIQTSAKAVGFFPERYIAHSVKQPVVQNVTVFGTGVGIYEPFDLTESQLNMLLRSPVVMNQPLYGSIGINPSLKRIIENPPSIVKQAQMKSSATVARQFIKEAIENGESLTPLQVLKLVYISHGWTLAFDDRPLIKDEIQAWKYGPVIPALYNRLRKYKDGPVEMIENLEDEVLDQTERDLVGSVYETYGKMSDLDLSRITHKKDSPWDLTYQNGSFGAVISDDLIKDHYARLID